MRIMEKKMEATIEGLECRVSHNERYRSLE